MNYHASILDKEVTSFIRSIATDKKQSAPLFHKFSIFLMKQGKPPNETEIDDISLDQKKPEYSLSIQLKALQDLLLGKIEIRCQEVSYLDDAESRIKNLSMFTRDKRVPVIAKK